MNPNNCINQGAWQLWGLRNGISFARFVHDTIDLALDQFHERRRQSRQPDSHCRHRIGSCCDRATPLPLLVLGDATAPPPQPMLLTSLLFPGECVDTDEATAALLTPTTAFVHPDPTARSGSGSGGGTPRSRLSPDLSWMDEAANSSPANGDTAGTYTQQPGSPKGHGCSPGSRHRRDAVVVLHDDNALATATGPTVPLSPRTSSPGSPVAVPADSCVATVPMDTMSASAPASADASVESPRSAHSGGIGSLINTNNTNNSNRNAGNGPCAVTVCCSASDLGGCVATVAECEACFLRNKVAHVGRMRSRSCCTGKPDVNRLSNINGDPASEGITSVFTPPLSPLRLVDTTSDHDAPPASSDPASAVATTLPPPPAAQSELTMIVPDNDISVHGVALIATATSCIIGLPPSPPGLNVPRPEAYLFDTIFDEGARAARVAEPLPAHLVPQAGPAVIYAMPDDENNTFTQKPRRTSGVRTAYRLYSDDECNYHSVTRPSEPLSSTDIQVPRCLPPLPEGLDFGQLCAASIHDELADAERNWILSPRGERGVKEERAEGQNRCSGA